MLSTTRLTSALTSTRLPRITLSSCGRTALAYVGTATAVAVAVGAAGTATAAGQPITPAADYRSAASETASSAPPELTSTPAALPSAAHAAVSVPVSLPDAQAAATMPAASAQLPPPQAASAGTASGQQQSSVPPPSATPVLGQSGTSAPAGISAQSGTSAQPATPVLGDAGTSTPPAAPAPGQSPAAPSASAPSGTSAPAAQPPASGPSAAAESGDGPQLSVTSPGAAAQPAQVPPAPPASAMAPLGTWAEVEAAVAGQSGVLPLMDMPLTGPVTAPQAEMPMSPVQWEHATTIVHEALVKHMGLRSAVIAVATAMQESQLHNISYGTYDSLGLFQQRPSAGWGTPAQVTDPVYAADAFLDALHTYQLSHPDWTSQPVWIPAQGVQDSAYPYAYAKWEIQAANIVMTISRNMLTGQ